MMIIYKKETTGAIDTTKRNRMLKDTPEKVQFSLEFILKMFLDLSLIWIK